MSHHRPGTTRPTPWRRLCAGGGILVLLASALVVGGPTLRGSGATTAAADTRPNILFLMVDDMRRDELRFMPKTVGWLAKGGVTFRNAIMPNPLCCPSRASVLTGRHAHNHKVWSHLEPYGFHSFDDRSTLPVWLRRAGYTTTYLGKYLNGYGLQPPPRRSTGRSVQYVPPGWSQWRASIDGGLPPGHRYTGDTYHYFDTTLNNNGKGFIGNQGRYQSDVYGEMTANTITRLAAKPAPFFSYVSFTAPHNGGPLEADDPGNVYSTWSGRMERMGTPARPGRVHGRFDRVLTKAPGRAWFSEAPTDLEGGYAKQPPITDQEWRYIKEAARQRAEAVSVVDANIDRIMRALQRSGELRRTLVVFTSDNGYFLGERRIRHGKSWPYGPSGRVPLLMRGPGIPAGQVRRDPYLSVDHAATLAAAARVVPPYRTDGISMLPVARRGDRGWNRPVLTESTPRLGQSDPSVRGIRTDDFFYTRWENGDEELFAVRSDPAERHNLARDPSYAAVLALMRSALASVQDCVGAGCSPPLDPGLARDLGPPPPAS